MAAVVETEKCTNCHRIIGSLEKPMLWAENIVCAGCYQTLHNPGGTVGVRAPVKVTPRLARVPYRERVGTRSYIFQIALIVWSVLVWGGLLALVLFAVIGSNPPSASPAENLQRMMQRENDRQFPTAAAAIAILGAFYVFLFTFWSWMVVALPLFIAAVATLQTKEEK